MKLTTRKVPLWWLLIALVVIFCCAIQICAEVKFHSEQRVAFIHSLASSADGVSQNLSIFSSDMSTSEEVEQSLIGACLYSEQLECLLYRVPRYTIFGLERGIFDELGNSPLQAFSFVSSQLKEILNEYQDENILSDESLSIILLISDAFSSFYNNLEERGNVSQKSLINYMNILCSTIYPY